MNLLKFCRRYCAMPQTVANLRTSTKESTNVNLEGWILRTQKRGKVNFMYVNDGLSSDAIQVVVPREVCSVLSVGAAVSVSGKWQKSQGDQQEMELFSDKCVVHVRDDDPRYATLTPDQLRKSIHLRSKSLSFAALLRLRARISSEIHRFHESRNYIYIDTPIITGNDCEGAGETFTLHADTTKGDGFFGKSSSFLSVSGQLHLEAMTSGISRVYTISNGLRADKQQSNCHLAEFKMLEVETAFMNNVDDLCDSVEDFVRHLLELTLNDPKILSDVKELGQYSSNDHLYIVESMLKTGKFVRMTYEKVKMILESKNQKLSGNGFSKQNELFMADYCKGPLFITNFPTSQKPLYMKRSEDDLYTDSFDFICPIVGELAGGSVREPSFDVLAQRGLNIPWYSEIRKRGKPVSAGFGLGFERLLQVLLGVNNIKDTIPFPRWYRHCQC